MNTGRARLESQSRQFCGACEAGVEHNCPNSSRKEGEDDE